MCHVFLDLSCSPSSFFKSWLSLLLNMQNHEDNYERAEREERKKNKQIIVNSKKNLVKESFIYDVQKKPKIQSPLSPCPHRAMV